jgi:phage terminase large subunit
MAKRLELPKKLQPLITTTSRYNVVHGGRGSAKSESVARALIIAAMQGYQRILCCREFQSSIRESVHALLKSVIVEHELQAYFEITYVSIKCVVTGSEFVFAGLAENSVDGIKSLFGFTIVWVEEAQRLSRRSMDLLLPTIRAKDSKFYFTFNPELETDPVYKRFVGSPDPQDDALVIEMNWNDNPWFPDVLRTEMEACKRRSNDDYLHIWEGKTRTFTKASILGHLVRIDAFEPEPDWTPYYSIDWGFSEDPTVGLRLFYANRKLYIRNESHTYHTEINEYSRVFRAALPGADHNVLWADNSRPESISYLNNPQNYDDRRPLKVKAAPKWSGSVEDGIAWLRSLDAIIIHPDCKASIYEIPRYSWKVDKVSGDVLPIPASGNDHCLVAGSLIQTTKGLVPIEQLTSGELYSFDESSMSVVTQKFFNARYTGTKKVLCVTLANSHKIVGSTKHFVLGEKGWKFLGDLEKGEKIVAIDNSLSMELVSSKTKNQDIIFAAIKSTEKENDCTDTFGKSITAQFQKVGMFITKTTTKIITTLRILKSQRHQPMRVTILGQKKEGKAQEKMCSRLNFKQFIGTNLKREESGTAKWQKLPHYSAKKLMRLVNIVEQVIKAKRQENSAQTTANPQQDGRQKLIRFQGNVAFVEFRSKLTNTQKSFAAPKSAELLTVVSIVDLGEQPVYNLEVENTHNYLDAAGIVHHNCVDAIRYACHKHIKKKFTIYDVI